MTDFAFATEPTDDKTITVADRVFVAAEGKWAYNDDTVTAANAAQYQMVIYDTTYDAPSLSTATARAGSRQIRRT